MYKWHTIRWSSITYKDIENFGKKKLGHIYRFLIILYSNAGIIIFRYFVLVKNENNNDRQNGVLQNFCRCSMGKKKGIKEYDFKS